MIFYVNGIEIYYIPILDVTKIQDIPFNFSLGGFIGESVSLEIILNLGWDTLANLNYTMYRENGKRNKKRRIVHGSV